MLYALEIVEKHIYTKMDFSQEDLPPVMWLNNLKLISDTVK